MHGAEISAPWSQPAGDPIIQPGQVDLWRIFLNLPPESVKTLASTLTADETGRAARFRFPADRNRYIAAHGALRDILARYLNREPGQVRFSANQYGKPTLPGCPLEFNLSHSGDFALVAVTRGRKVGVDVERFRPDVDFERLASRFFSSREAAELTAFPAAQRLAAFFRCWTRKEAYIKAQGLGLSLPLKDFDVSLGDPALLYATRPDAEEAGHWRVFSLQVDPFYAGAVVVERVGPGLQGKGIELNLWDWNGLLT